MHTLQSILSSKNRNCRSWSIDNWKWYLSLTLGLIVNWRRENLAVSQQAEVHIANELLPMSNWAEIKNTVPCRKLMTAFPLKCALIPKSNPTKAEITSTFIHNIVGLHFHKGSFSIILNKLLYKGDFQQ